MKPFVSVIVPCYNGAEFIQDAIYSVLNQTYKDFEVIVIDDGSIDDTRKKVTSIQDDRIKYIYKSNTGVSHSRNVGIEQARGEYIAFLDADDIFLPDNLMEKVTALNNRKECGLVHAPEQRFAHGTGELLEIVDGLEGFVLYDLLEMRTNVIHSPSSVVCRRSLLDELHGFDVNLSTSADWDLWVRVAQRSPIEKVNKVLSRYRVHPNQMHMNTAKMEADTRYAFRKFRALNFFKDEQHYHQCFAQKSLILSASYLGIEKDFFKFLRFFILALIHHPRTVIIKVKDVVMKPRRKR